MFRLNVPAGGFFRGLDRGFRQLLGNLFGRAQGYRIRRSGRFRLGWLLGLSGLLRRSFWLHCSLYLGRTADWLNHWNPPAIPSAYALGTLVNPESRYDLASSP